MSISANLRGFMPGFDQAYRFFGLFVWIVSTTEEVLPLYERNRNRWQHMTFQASKGIDKWKMCH